MSMSINEVRLIGRIGQDPEIRYSNDGLPIATFSLATGYNKKDGSQHTDWHRITAFGKVADIVSQWAKKGARLYIEGRLSEESYTDKDGQKRHATKVIASICMLLDKPDLDPPQRSAQPGAQPNAQQSPPPVDDDIPF